MFIFQCNDSKSFLRHYIDHLPKRGRGEVSRMARHLRISTTLVSQVLAGNKHFTPEQTQALTSYLGLSELEAEYFLFLVQSERAGSVALKQFWKTKLQSLREKSLHVANRVKISRTLSDSERALFYSSGLYSAIRLYTSTSENGKSQEEIGRRFELTRAKTAEMVHFLLESGLCMEKNGKYFVGPQSTHLDASSPHLHRHHSNWRMRAIQQSEDLSSEELMYTAPVSLSKKDFQKLREEMVEFIKHFLDTVHASPAEEVACLNLDFFWVQK